MTRKTFLQFNSFWKLHAWDNATNSTSSQSCVAAQAEHVNFCQLSNRAPPQHDTPGLQDSGALSRFRSMGPPACVELNAVLIAKSSNLLSFLTVDVRAALNT